MDELRRALATRVDDGELPGLVYAVATAGGAIRVDAIGVKEFGGGEPMRRETVFRIASVTKPMLAAVTMMLVEDGALALAEPVDRLLPELADRRVLRRPDGPLDDTEPAARPITVEDVLTFRMGHGILLDPAADPPVNPPYPVVRAAQELRLTLAEPDPRTPHGVDEWTKLFGTLPLLHQPGTHWTYNSSALVLGVLVARAAGRPLETVMRERLFGPLGMTKTGFSLPPELANGLPAYYLGGERQEVSRPDEWARPPAFPSGAGGLASTVDDVLTFGRFLLAGGVHNGTRLLRAESVARMTTNHLTPEQIAGGGMLLGGHGWGYGTSVTVEPDEVSPPGRYGWDGGYGTSWCNDPDSGRVCVLLTQVSDVLWNGTVTEFQRLAVRAAV
ncbi:serine hydrolase domain-containing protein [Dactylosporangium fulvum]|uniref:Beta-lactamase family protein n=1 Tax=Dactylosporangium fulvum TaxID=53359 RepID=A0ABY5WBC2_9ACTN|nr:serine hydrolase domain-containing protein [Dactylosporangium fulvum]UWP87167.1 beta-lactamase family protein [Dactylosporangium fulvum]